MKQWMRMTAGLGLLLALPWAQAEEAPACIEVTVGGYKTPDYNCLSRQMGNDPQAAATAQRAREALDVPVNERAPNSLGLVTPAATGVRMGNAFGNSVKPQRPPAAPNNSPLPK
ncbi:MULTISPECIES: hypothetical protein [Pseudomonas]|uniref:Periplasmic protein n=3 Tax=Pseudomonas TaxID=286 RepID=A0A0G3GFA7_9PSED|nr:MULTISPECIES: hypothetical protein [Pseudomonas]AKJ99793.1 hypothetical protein VM99_17595 [Pseudomonas chlororaphis]KIQ57083.1 hypothetical protein RL74_22715 [Pseudomonas fluorescens]ROM83572.1 hypothetical protein BK652_14670 [Pseudomonas brassicacearum]BBP65382.1 hypothetical protein PHLH5_29230 [Pseudomonas sp. Cab53]